MLTATFKVLGSQVAIRPSKKWYPGSGGVITTVSKGEQSQTAPRVDKTLITMIEEEEEMEHSIGTVIKRKFDGKMHTITVKRYDDTKKLIILD